MSNKNRIIITPGEPSGIGLDLTVQIAQFNWPSELVVCCSRIALQDRALKLGLPLILKEYIKNKKPKPQKISTLNILNIDTEKRVKTGHLCVDNSHYVIKTLVRACNGCINGEFDAMVTGPVHKGIINDAGFLFIGHTEFLAKHAGVKKVVMMFEKKGLRIALATTHIPLKQVSNAITRENLKEIINILYHDLQNKFSILKPHILVCGLNPHAGEGGYIGTEEINIINPTLEEIRKCGINIVGPLPADTIFQPKYLNNADVILSMYHDQSLPVLKSQGFNNSVNITLGLPFIRTSVDHGIALELAGLGLANKNSFMKAINLAIKIVNNKK